MIAYSFQGLSAVGPNCTHRGEGDASRATRQAPGPRDKSSPHRTA
jgi:hypothetical protein